MVLCIKVEECVKGLTCMDFDIKGQKFETSKFSPAQNMPTRLSYMAIFASYMPTRSPYMTISANPITLHGDSGTLHYSLTYQHR